MCGQVNYGEKHGADKFDTKQQRESCPARHHPAVQIFSKPPALLEGFSSLVRRFRNRQFRLKLVCDKCHEPCEPGYVIEKASDTLVDLLPALQVSFEVRSGLTQIGLGGLAWVGWSVFFYVCLSTLHCTLLSCGQY